MLLNIDHKLTYEYETPPDFIALRLKLFPNQFQSQHVIDWTVHINDQKITNKTQSTYSNLEAFWLSRKIGQALTITAIGQVETHDAAGVLRGLKDYTQAGVFLRNTKFTAPDKAIKDLAHSVKSDDPLDRMHLLSELIHKTLKPEDTKKAEPSTAAQVLEVGKGNAAEYAHLFVTAARDIKHAARCVIGYMYSDEKVVNSPHAWAEVKIPSIGWVGFDAMNKVCPTEHYIRLNCGLDCQDAAINRLHEVGATDKKLRSSLSITGQPPNEH